MFFKYKLESRATPYADAIELSSGNDLVVLRVRMDTIPEQSSAITLNNEDLDELLTALLYIKQQRENE